MVENLDIYATVKLLIEQHGEGVWIEAAVKHREMVENGDEEGAAVWLRAANAIAALDNMEGSSEVH